MAGRRILIDGSMTKRGGGFTFLVNMVPELARLSPGDSFRIVVGDSLLARSIPKAPNLEVTFLGDLGLLQRLRFTYLHAGRMAREWRADLYFSAGEMAPLFAGCPTIAAFQNPNVFNFGKGQGITFKQKLRLYALNAFARLSALFVDRVMFVSGDSAEWMGDAIGLPLDRRAVVRHGIDSGSWRNAQPVIRAALRRPYILSVSSVYPYKNYVRLIEAWCELARRQPSLPDLVIVGDCQDPATSERMAVARRAAGPLAARIHILGEVPYSEIRGYYRNASLFVFPSYLETFGIPLLEAFASETPLVAADTKVFREIASDAAFYANPFDASALAQAMEQALFKAGAAETLVKRGRERLEHFTWRGAAETLMSVFETALATQERRERDSAESPRRLARPIGARPVHGGVAAHAGAWRSRAAARALRSH